MDFGDIVRGINDPSERRKIESLVILYRGLRYQSPLTSLLSSDVVGGIVNAINQPGTTDLLRGAILALSELLQQYQDGKDVLRRHMNNQSLQRLISELTSYEAVDSCMVASTLLNVALTCDLKEDLKQRGFVEAVLTLVARSPSPGTLDSVASLIAYLYDLLPMTPAHALDSFQHMTLGMLWYLASFQSPDLPDHEAMLPVILSALHQSQDKTELKWALTVLKSSLGRTPKPPVGDETIAKLKIPLRHDDTGVVGTALLCLSLIAEGGSSQYDCIIRNSLHKFVPFYAYVRSGVAWEACSAAQGIVLGGKQAAVETLGRLGMLEKVPQLLTLRQAEPELKKKAFEVSLLFIEHGDNEKIYPVLSNLLLFLRAAKRAGTLQSLKPIIRREMLAWLRKNNSRLRDRNLFRLCDEISVIFWDVLGLWNFTINRDENRDGTTRSSSI